MSGSLVLLVAGIALSSAQLNYEGSPLTENTDYAAEESRASSRALAAVESATRVTDHPTYRPQKLYTAVERAEEPIDALHPDKEISQGLLPRSSPDARTAGRSTAGLFVERDPNGIASSAHAAQMALNTFLNSKTPEESRLSLEHYLHTRATEDGRLDIGKDSQMFEATGSPEQQRLVSRLQGDQAQTPDRSPIVAAQLPQPLQTLSGVYEARQPFQRPAQLYDPGQPTVDRQNLQTLSKAAKVSLELAERQAMQPVAYVPGATAGIQARGDFLPIAWRTRRIRRPTPFPQPRISPGLYKTPLPVPTKPNAPVELIYTRPPGFHVRDPGPPPPFANPAGPWFVDAGSGYPPHTKDILYSQLYAQSYDPHYYSYIGKTGKIKPYLYGKLGKHRGEEEGGIWTELYRSFTKHGLKNIMTPGFLLGMTLPVVTLMLTALVQKRSFGRSDARNLSQEDSMILEYLERLQGAMQRYEKKTRKDQELNVDDC